MVSLDEVARTAGVSSATVSRALSGRGHVSAATRDRVLEAAEQLGYVVSSAASSLASGRKGFNDALRQYGVEPNDQLSRAADFTIAGGYQAAKQLFGLTTVDQHPLGQGRTAAEHILGRVEGQGSGGIELPFELVVRSTSAAPSQAVDDSH